MHKNGWLVFGSGGFSSKEAYESFKNSEQSTTEKYRNAIEQNAWDCCYIKPGETCFLDITDDTVLLLDMGEAILEPVQMAWMP